MKLFSFNNSPTFYIHAFSLISFKTAGGIPGLGASLVGAGGILLILGGSLVGLESCFIYLNSDFVEGVRLGLGCSGLGGGEIEGLSYSGLGGGVLVNCFIGVSCFRFRGFACLFSRFAGLDCLLSGVGVASFF